MEKILILILYGLTYVEWMSFYYVVLKEKVQKPATGRLIVFVLLLILRIAGILWNGHMYILLDVVWIAFTCAFYAFSVRKAMKAWIIMLIIISILESCVDRVLAAFSVCSSYHRLVRVIVCGAFVTGIVWIYYLVIGRKIHKEKIVLPKKVWTLFGCVMFVIMFMIVYYEFVLEEIPDITMVKIGSLLILSGGISISMMMVAVVYYINSTIQYRLQNEMLELYNEQQREYFTKMLEKEEDTRHFRHDITNHLMAIKNIAESEKVCSYVEDLLQDIQNQEYAQYDVGNDVVNGIINYYLLPLNGRCDIKVDGYIGDVESVSSKDLCTIVSNVIKNAVEAVEKVEGEQCKITVVMNRGQKYMKIHVENSIDEEIVMDADGLPRTSKQDSEHHGLGLRNMVCAVEKNHGTYSIQIQDHMFIIDINLRI